MTQKAEIKACLIASLEIDLDPYMKKHGFVRRARSLIYNRKREKAIQTIDVMIQFGPTDNRNAVAAVYPMMSVIVPEVDHVFDEMINGNYNLLIGITGGRSSQPIDFTSEKAELGRWFVYQPDSVPRIVRDLGVFIERWTMPFLDVYATPEEILAADERKDGRIVVDRAHMIRVVAAALVCNRKDYAQAMLEKRLGAPELRRRYQQVFDYIESSP
jgi:hypothetical protein